MPNLITRLDEFIETHPEAEFVLRYKEGEWLAGYVVPDEDLEGKTTGETASETLNTFLTAVPA